MASKQTKESLTKPKQAFARELRHWIDKRYDGNQTKAGKALGVSQSHLSQLLSGMKGPGLPTLLMMRLETGKTIDELLGFSSSPEAETMERLVKSVEVDVARMKRELEELRAKQEKRDDADDGASSDGPNSTRLRKRKLG